jgi:hypothetical protein
MNYRALPLLSIALCLTACATHSKAYRQTLNAEQLRLALLHEIKPGDRIEHVREILGPGKPVTDKRRQSVFDFYYKAQKKLGAEFREAPDGIAATDVLLYYPFNRDGCSGIFLQFRYGRLINFNRNDFQAPDVFATTVNRGPN